ncbi:MAG: hypothetical protein ACNYPH_00605 [Gammaproteobacteria bacterium WSBS_2016_MAG_OTU1]
MPEIWAIKVSRLPPGSFIIIPPGSTLDFLSPNRHSTVGFSAETADIAFLPPDITARVVLGGTEDERDYRWRSVMCNYIFAVGK